MRTHLYSIKGVLNAFVKYPLKLMDIYSELPIEKASELFCNKTESQTPKLDTRAPII